MCIHHTSSISQVSARASKRLVAMVIAAACTVPVQADTRRIEVIQPRHFDIFMQWLDLDDDQRVVASSFHEPYWRSCRVELIPVGQEYHAQLPDMLDPEFAQIFRRLAPERRALIDEVERRDNELFTQIESILTDEQQPRMVRVRFARQRQFWRTSRRELPEGNVDLAALTLQLELAEEEEAHVFEVLDWYEPLLLHALKKSRQSLFDRSPVSIERAELEKVLMEDGNRPPSERMDAAERARVESERLELYKKIARMIARPGEALFSLNRSALGRFKAVLDEESRAHIERLYLETSYPEAYPDPVNAETLYTAALGLDDLAEEQRVQLELFEARFLQSHRQASKTLAEALLNRRRAGRTGDPQVMAIGMNLEVLFKPGLARESLNQSQVKLVRTVLTPEQANRLPQTWDYEENPPERPWDWGNRVRGREARAERARRAGDG